MAGSVARGENYFHCAIAEQIVMVRRGSIQEIPAQTRAIEIFPNIAAAREPVGCKSILVLRALNDVERFREASRRACVVEVQMRKQHVRNARWVDTHARQFIDTALLFGHHGIINVGDRTPMGVRVRDALHRVAAVNHDVSFRMLNQKPGDRNFIRFVEALIHFDVVQLALQRAALEHIQTKVCHRMFWGVKRGFFL